MTARLTQIWRHPIKSLGRERLGGVALRPNACLPHDRRWAVTHDRAKVGDGDGWAHCANFLRCATGPGLMAITASLNEASDTVTLDHPQAGQLVLNPEDQNDVSRLIGWLSGIWPADRPAPTGIHTHATGSLTDQSEPFVSLHNHASHRAVEERVGMDLSVHRWRGNLWIEGLAPWQEFEWIGQEVRIGSAILQVEERIGRCKATMANPETGIRDADVEAWYHAP